MEIRFSDEALAFEAEVKEFLAKAWIPEIRRRVQESLEAYEEERGFRHKLAERGWLTMSWPEEYGGEARSFESQYLFQEACNYVGAPTVTVAVQAGRADADAVRHGRAERAVPAADREGRRGIRPGLN